MNLLAVDTTGPFLSAAASAAGRVVSLHRPVKTPLDELLIPAVERLLARARLKPSDLDAVAAASGPGRFTGIRVGMAYAAVAAARLGVPALAVSRLEALAWKGPAGGVLAVLEGWKEEKFAQPFRREGRAPRPAAPPEWIAAPDWARRRDEWAGKGFVPFAAEAKAADLLAPAEAWLKKKRRPRFAPLYLKPASYENPTRVGR